MQEPTENSTWKRLQRGILLLLFFAITINLLDRQVLSLVAPVLRDQLHLSSTQYGVIVFAFLFGMAVGQVPIGILIDRVGARRGMVAIVAWWSASNLAHAFMGTVSQFSAARFLLGFGECGNYSAGAKVIGQWFAPKDRALAAGIFNGGALAGTIVAPPLITWLMIHFGWRRAFLVPSIGGLIWVLPWLRTYWEPWKHLKLPQDLRDQAMKDHAKSGGPQPATSTLLALAPVWGVILMRAFGAPVTHFFYYWLPEYLKHGRGMSLEAIGLTAWIPALAGGIGNVGGGWLSRVLMNRGWTVDVTRKVILSGAMIVCLLAMMVPLAPTPAAAIALICVASLAINAYAANLVGLITDLFPQAILARVTGLTGVGDNVMSMAAMLLTGVVVDRFSYTPVFIALGILPVLSVTAFFGLVRVVRPVAFSPGPTIKVGS